MKRYLWAYGIWLGAVLAAAAACAWWYKRVENIGLEELAQRMAENENGATPAPPVGEPAPHAS